METDLERIWQHLEWIAAEPRAAETARLEECRRYCEQQLTRGGWQVQRRPFTATSSEMQPLSGVNLIATHPLASDQQPTLILGAHLDSRENTPGADDNASAVAVLLETARLAGTKFSAAGTNSLTVNLQLAVFDLEEHGMLGGAFHAATCRAAGHPVAGMVSLEMLGYCSHRPGSQMFPPELAEQYPDVGNFIGVVGNQISGPLLQAFCRAFESVADLPCEALQVSENGQHLPPTRLSDHSPFWDAGFAALMVTDTSFMRNPHYHQPTDTPDTLDREFLHKVAEGVWRATSEITARGIEAG
ncbi:MAG: M28 family peptidase [Fuerstiella sp.]